MWTLQCFTRGRYCQQVCNFVESVIYDHEYHTLPVSILATILGIHLLLFIMAVTLSPSTRHRFYDEIPSVWRDRLEKLKSELPTSLSAIAFSRSVRIKSVLNNEYLFSLGYVPCFFYCTENVSYRVYTGNPNPCTEGGKWKISISLPQSTSGILVWKAKTYLLRAGSNSFVI